MSRNRRSLTRGVVGLLTSLMFLTTGPDARASADDGEAAEETRQLADYHGTFRYVGGQREQDKAWAAMEEVLAGLNVLLRPIARKYLKPSTTAPPTWEIDIDGETVSLSAAGKPAIVDAIGGGPIKHKAMDGKYYEVSHHYRSERLTQKHVGNRSVTRKVFRLSADGQRMTVRTKIEHPMMDKPLVWTFTYVRQ